METLRNLWSSASPYRGWLLPLLGVLLLAAVGAALWAWRRRRARGATTLGAPPPMSGRRLRQVRQDFLAALPLLQRAAVKDLPNIVVLGPAGSGKSKLVALDVDWQRQSRQFLPSHTSDSLLKLYLGPDSVVQELSAPLLEDDTPQARRALRGLWRDAVGGGQHALAILVLDVRWLAETPPDEVRRVAQLLRGKLNLLAEVRRAPLETRVCLTHMDSLEGYEDFAALLNAHHVPLSFEMPARGEEGQVASLLQAQERYLALGLTSLPVESFERLERFYSQGHGPFEALARFATALLEGGSLTFMPRLTRVCLSSPSSRAAGVLSVPGEAHDARMLHRRYLGAHLKRAALLATVCALPMLSAYAYFAWRLSQAEERVDRFENTVKRMREQGEGVSGSAVQEQVLAAGDATDTMWQAMGYWPLLPYSFSTARENLLKHLTRGIRDAHLRPALERCQKDPSPCRPEQVVFLLATVYASREEELGRFVLSSLHKLPSWSFVSKDGGVASPKEQSLEARRSWLTAVNLDETLVGDYVVISKGPWHAETPDEEWARWPFREALTLEGQLAPWQDHLKRLRDFLQEQALEPWTPERLDVELKGLQEQRLQLQAWLEDSATFATLPRVLDLLKASEANVDTSKFKGLSSTLRAVEWMNKNREALSAVLHMEEEACENLKTLQKLSVAELLVRDGVWTPASPATGLLRVTVTQGPFEFSPLNISRQMHQAILRYYLRTGHLPFGTSGGAQEESGTPGVSRDRLTFDTRIRPLVDAFTQMLKTANLPVEEASQRQVHVRSTVEQFAVRYRQRLFQRVKDYSFDTASPAQVARQLSDLTQPSSELVDMLREVSNGASLEPLEGPYYESLRNALSAFKPLVQMMKSDESGTYPQLKPYRLLVTQLNDELNAVSRGGARPPAEAGPEATGGAARLTEMLSPLGRVAFSMLLEEEGSYLRKVDAWLDQQEIVGELRRPFREPFLVVRDLGRQELQRVLHEQWESTYSRMLRPLMERYPFNPTATQEVEPGDLEILRRQDGALWAFVNRVVAPVGEERGTEWVLRTALRERLEVPDTLLPTLSRMSRLSRVLWDAEGHPRPLMLQVMPQPLPPSPQPGSFVTLGSLKCGKTAAFAYNQSPSWQAFSVEWWDQQTASLMLEVRSPEQQSIQYGSLEKTRSAWSCFRLLEASLATGDQQRLWKLRGKSAENAQHVLEIRFGLKGEPWTPFREVPQ